MHVWVVDDHPLMAEAVRLALLGVDSQADVETFATLSSALERAAREPTAELCLLDLGLPETAGIEGLVRLREASPALPIVVFSGHDDRASIVAALEAGAMGFIPKTSPSTVLIAAIRLVLAGGVYIPAQALTPGPAADSEGADGADRSAVADRRADTTAVGAQAQTRSADSLNLSPRQFEVLGLLLKGLPNKLIARQLDISENTAKIHVSSVLRALGVTSRTQALVAAHRLGLRIP